MNKPELITEMYKIYTSREVEEICTELKDLVNWGRITPDCERLMNPKNWEEFRPMLKVNSTRCKEDYEKALSTVQLWFLKVELSKLPESLNQAHKFIAAQWAMPVEKTQAHQAIQGTSKGIGLLNILQIFH